MPFTGLVQEPGGSCYIETFTLWETLLNASSDELWLFSRPVTVAGENAAHSISDADMLYCVTVIATGTYFASALNTMTQVQHSRLVTCEPNQTGLWGLLVTRGTPTYAANGVKLRLTCLAV